KPLKSWVKDEATVIGLNLQRSATCSISPRGTPSAERRGAGFREVATGIRRRDGRIYPILPCRGGLSDVARVDSARRRDVRSARTSPGPSRLATIMHRVCHAK